MSTASTASDAATSAPFDQQYIDMMTPHHQGATMMAETALSRAQHPALKTMAEAMIRDQNAEIVKMKSWRKAWYGSDVTPPMDQMPMLNGMAHSQAMDMKMVNETLKTADPFDKAFIDAMIDHHKMAIEASALAKQKAEHAEIKQLASEMSAAQQKEIDEMTAWRAAWYP